MRKLLALLALAAGLYAQAPNRYYISASTTKLTIMQPATGDGNQVQFGLITVSCAADQTMIEEWNGAAATATAGIIKKAPGTFQNPLATAWTGSNVGLGTTGPTYTIPAGQTVAFDGSGIRMGPTGTGTNYSIGTSGACTITIAWNEGIPVAPYPVTSAGAVPMATFGAGGGSVSGTVTVNGAKSANAVVPGATNLGTLPCVATTAAPSYTTTFQVPCSTDLAGNTRVIPIGSAATGAAVVGAPVYAAGIDTAGNVRPPLFNTAGVAPIGAAGSAADGIANSIVGLTVCATGFTCYQPIWPYVFNGSTWDRSYACTNTAAISVSAAATTEIIALTASTKIRICSGLLSISLTGTATIVQGTGTNCGTGQAGLTGAINLTTATPVPFNGGSSPLLQATTANAVCITAATGNVTGWFTYAKF